MRFTIPSHTRFLIAFLTLVLAPRYALAICSGASSPIALQTFENDPAAWLAANGGSADLGAQVTALAAAAVNSKDKGFGAALSTLLGSASGDQGTAIGKGLGGLENSCTDSSDPADAADKQYIALNIAPNMRANVSANTAYGDTTGPQTASTGAGAGAGGGGAGGGAGVGGQTGTGTTTGGTSGGIPATPNGGTQTAVSQLTTFGASGATTIPTGSTTIP